MDVVHSAPRRVDYDLRVMSWHDAEHSPLDLGRIDLIARLHIHTSTWIPTFFPSLSQISGFSVVLQIAPENNRLAQR